MRRLIGEMVNATPGFTVAGVARDGVDALAQIERLAPDIVTLDLEMPQLDGMEVLARVMRVAPMPVVVLSAGGEHYQDATLRALEIGAVDFVRKPSGPISLDLDSIRGRLQQALEAAATSSVSSSVAGAAATDIAPAAAPRPVRSAGDGALVPPVARQVVVIAASTGGPRALSEIVPALSPDLPAAVIVAQHLPREFTPSFAARLDRTSALRVSEAHDGLVPREGNVYVAPGAAHTRLAGTTTEPVLSVVPATGDPGAVSPSADILFRTAAAVFGAACTAVVLTGMGRDGADGLRAVRAAGGHAVVQDRDTSAVYGMPRAALGDAGSDRIVPLADVAGAIEAAVRRRQNAAPVPAGRAGAASGTGGGER